MGSTQEHCSVHGQGVWQRGRRGSVKRNVTEKGGKEAASGCSEVAGLPPILYSEEQKNTNQSLGRGQDRRLHDGRGKSEFGAGESQMTSEVPFSIDGESRRKGKRLSSLGLTRGGEGKQHHGGE